EGQGVQVDDLALLAPQARAAARAPLPGDWVIALRHLRQRAGEADADPEDERAPIGQHEQAVVGVARIAPDARDELPGAGPGAGLGVEELAAPPGLQHPAVVDRRSSAGPPPSRCAWTSSSPQRRRPRVRSRAGWPPPAS